MTLNLVPQNRNIRLTNTSRQVNFVRSNNTVEIDKELSKEMSNITNNNVIEELKRTDGKFQYVPIDMNKEIQGNTVLRFCASEKSIPPHATRIISIFGNNGFHKQSTFNELTGLAYGFSYIVPHGTDPSIKHRKIELDILNDKNVKTLSIDSPNWFIDRNEFVNYYSDEEFDSELDLESNLDYTDNSDFEESNQTNKYEYNSFCPDYESHSSSDDYFSDDD
jgi:hypothetical protein